MLRDAFERIVQTIQTDTFRCAQQHEPLTDWSVWVEELMGLKVTIEEFDGMDGFDYPKFAKVTQTLAELEGK